MACRSIAVIPGGGIGTEAVPEGVRVVEASAARHGAGIDRGHFPWSCAVCRETGRMMPGDGLDRLAGGGGGAPPSRRADGPPPPPQGREDGGRGRGVRYG